MDQNQKIIRVLIADDHPLVLDGLRSRLDEDPDIHVVAQCKDGREVLNYAQSKKPDIALLDISMPHVTGLEAAEELNKILPQIRVLMLSMHDNKAYIKQALKAGAKGYIMKDSSSQEMIRAVKDVYDGKSFYSASVTDILFKDENKTTGSLTDRECDIIKLLAEGNSNKHVARKLEISVRTVETHRRNIKRKLNLSNSAGLVKYAIENGLVRI